jgi:hypothetical protein
LDPFEENPSTCINLLLNPNSNDCPSTNLTLLINTYNSSGINIITWVCVPTFSICILVACKLACVCCCVDDVPIVAIAYAVVNAKNVVDFHGCPSNLNKCPHLFVDSPQPLEF